MADGTVKLEMEGFELLQKCSMDQANKIIHELMDFVCDGRQPSYQKYSDVWSIEEWKILTKKVKESLKQFISRGFTKDEIIKELESTSLSPEIRQAVVDCLWPRKDEIHQSLKKSTATISHAYLKDFDWKVKLTMASDKLSSIREPLASVDFHIEHGQEKKQVSVELSKEQLKNMISSLEAANKHYRLEEYQKCQELYRDLIKNSQVNRINPVTVLDVSPQSPVYALEHNTNRRQLVATGDAEGFVKIWRLGDDLTNQGTREMDVLTDLANAQTTE